ncbi:MAG TPA: DUF3617 family protein [Thermodesulfobacteriota bacterium]|nr:DUF3617 family protein [Thermodesulfobacteriota bacterium]
MTKKIIFSILAAAVVFFAANANAGLDMQDGKWEITTEIEMLGMPIKMPPVTVTECLTSKAPVPEEKGEGMECKMVEQKVSGDTITWKVKCSGSSGESEGSGSVTYKGDRMEGVMKMKAKHGNEMMEMTSRMKGRRIGKCD